MSELTLDRLAADASLYFLDICVQDMFWNIFLGDGSYFEVSHRNYADVEFVDVSLRLPVCNSRVNFFYITP